MIIMYKFDCDIPQILTVKLNQNYHLIGHMSMK